MLATVGIVVGAVFTAFGLIMATVGVVGVVVGVMALGHKCVDLGPDVHQVGGTIITCG